jgi:hypothetical protein
VSTISIESLENSMDFSRQENLLELEEGGILSYTMSKVRYGTPGVQNHFFHSCLFKFFN